MTDLSKFLTKNNHLYQKPVSFEKKIDNNTYAVSLIKKKIKVLNEIHNVDYSEKFWQILLLPFTQQLFEILEDRYNLLDSISSKHKFKFKYNKKYVSSYLIKNRNIFSDLRYFADDDKINFFLCSFIVSETSLKKSFFIKDDNKISKFDSEHIKVEKPISLTLFILTKIKSLFTFLAKKFNRKLLFFDFSVPAKSLIKISLKLGQFPSFASHKVPHKKPHSKFRENHEEHLLDLNKSEIFNFFNKNYIKFLPVEFLENFSENDKEFKSIHKIKYICCSRPTSANYAVRFALAHLLDNGGKLLTYQHGGGYGLYKLKSLELLENNMSDHYHSWTKNFIVRDDLLNDKLIEKTKKEFSILIIGPSFYKYNIYNFGGHHPYFNNEIEKRLKELIESFSNQNQKFHYRSYRGTDDRITKNFSFYQKKASLRTLINKSELVICCNPYTQVVESLVSGAPTFLFWGKEHLFKNDIEIEVNSTLKNKILFNDPSLLVNHIKSFQKNAISWEKQYVLEKNFMLKLWGNLDNNWSSKTINKLNNLILNGEYI